MSEPICKSCGNSGRDMFGNACICGQAPIIFGMYMLNFAMQDALAKAKAKLNSVPLKVKRLHPDAVLPTYAKPGDAGMDLTAIDNGTDNYPADEPTRSYYYREYSTGIAVEIPPGYVGLIFPRSSVSKTGLSLANCVGVIDSGYRGEIKFRFKIDGTRTVLGGVQGLKGYVKGDRIGQLIVMPYPQVAIEEVTELSESERGTGGFGSSGA